MNEKIESALDSAKNFWDRNKGKIAVISTATTVGLVMILRSSNRTVHEFLVENELEEEFWKFIGADEDDMEMFKSN